MINCDLNVIEKEILVKDVQSLIEKYFLDFSNACLVYEGIQQALLMPLLDWKYADNRAKSCLRLVISDANNEIRLEKAPSSNVFFTRIIEEKASDGPYYKKDEELILRKSRSISESIFANGKGVMLNREYYKADDDGMLTFFADRLCSSRVR